jgi:hypothetical protein
LGYVVGRDGEGQAMVRFAGTAAPVVARTLGSIANQIDRAIERRLPVMLGFLDGRADAPVVMGIANLDDLPETAPTASAGSPTIEVIEAREELLLRCGEASIRLRADGTVQIRGRDVTSWARRRQRIRGGSVSIN